MEIAADAVPLMNSDPHKLAGIGDVETLKLLLEPSEGEGVDVNCLDKYGTSMLIWATRNGKADAAQYLIGKGADLEKGGFGGMRPIHHVCNQIQEDLLTNLIKDGADVNSTDDVGNTPLHWACERGVLNPVQALIEAGADLNASNASGTTPLHKACNNGHLTCVHRLVHNGAGLEAADNAGNTALHVAAMAGFSAICSYLISSDAKVAPVNKDGKKPAEYAVTEEMSEMFSEEEAKKKKTKKKKRVCEGAPRARRMLHALAKRSVLTRL